MQPESSTSRLRLARPGWWAAAKIFLFRPNRKTLPLALVLVCLSGAIQGLPVAWLFGWLLNIDWKEVFGKREMMYPFACLVGACYSLCNYLLCVLPVEYLRPRLQTYPASVTYLVAIAGAILSTLFGCLLAFSRVGVGYLLGASFVKTQPPTAKLAALSLLLTANVMLLIIVSRSLRVEAENRERALREAAALAKAHALQSQINPHFFFNTLTTISALAELDSRAAKELVGQLAQLFRYTLSCSQCELVTIAQELEFVTNYLLVEQARYRSRLRFEMPSGSAGTVLRVPGLTLQPLVENAIRHGIAKRRDGGTIRIDLERAPTTPDSHGSGSEPAWILSVANQIPVSEGPPLLDPDQIFRPGHALANTRERLALAFQGRARLEFQREGAEWVKVVLRLPAMQEPS